MFQQSLGIHPFEKERWPIGDWRWIGLSNAEAMAHTRINMELGGNMETAQSKIEFGQALRDIGPVVSSASQKARGVSAVSLGSWGMAGYKSAWKSGLEPARSIGSCEEGDPAS